MCRRFPFHIFYLCIYISLVIGVDGGIMTYTSYEGGSVNIRCPYDAQFINNTKYLCRGKCSILQVLAGEKYIPIQTGKTPKDTRFSLNEDKTATTFTITDLRGEDGGQYWCAVRRLLPPDVYSEVLLSVKKVSQMFGVKGDELSVQCHYDKDVINNNKFLCKGEDLSLCETSGVKVLKVKTTNGRFSLIDDTSARVFTVTITDLTEEDSGIYWCGNALKGSQQAQDKWISAVILNISEDTSESTSHKPTTASFHMTPPASTYYSSRPATSSLPSSLLSSPSARSMSPNTETSLFGFITLSVVAMLILFGFVLFIYFRRRKQNEQLQLSGVAHGSDGNQNNGEIRQTKVSVCDYEEIHLTNVHPDYGLVLPVSDEHDASVNALAQNVSCDIHYSTIEHTDHSDRTSDGHTLCDYATVVL